MSRTNAVNFSGALQFPMADAGTDIFLKEDVQTLAKAVDQHDHTSGKGLLLAPGSIPTGSITSAMIADGTIVAGDIADGAITSAKILDGTIATSDLADKSVAAIKMVGDYTDENQLCNGSFTVWQRGTSGSGLNGYTADRWSTQGSGSGTLTWSRVVNSLQLQYTHVAGGSCTVNQFVEATHLAGKQISVAFDLWSNGGSGNPVWSVEDNLGNPLTNTSNGSPNHPGNSTWQRMTMTGTVASGITRIALRIYWTATAQIQLSDAMMVVGPNPPSFRPLHPADELARCLRYYEMHGNGGNYPSLMGLATAVGNVARVPISFAVQKAVTPTVTKNGTWVVSNSGQPGIAGNANQMGYLLDISSTATGNFYALVGGAGQSITAEANI